MSPYSVFSLTRPLLSVFMHMYMYLFSFNLTARWYSIIWIQKKFLLDISQTMDDFFLSIHNVEVSQFFKYHEGYLCFSFIFCNWYCWYKDITDFYMLVFLTICNLVLTY